MWDVLKRGTSQVLFSDLTEVVKPSSRCFYMTLLLRHTAYHVLAHYHFVSHRHFGGSVLVSTVEHILDLCTTFVSKNKY